jgi:adenine-specific DNA-methyltransferase
MEFLSNLPSERWCELTSSPTDWNMSVRPLPNLETKFVAANTLIGVNRPGQQLLRNRVGFELDVQRVGVLKASYFHKQTESHPLRFKKNLGRSRIP